MKSILSFAFLFIVLGIKAQNNLVVFTENGEKFFLMVNGVKQNLESETNVKVTDLIQPTYKIKIVFEDQSKGIIDHTIYLMDGGVPVKSYEFVYGVKLKKEGYKIRPVSSASISEAKADPSQTVVHYATSEPTADNNNVIINGTDDVTGVSVTPVSDNQSNVQMNQTTSQNNSNAGTTNTSANLNGLAINVNGNSTAGSQNPNKVNTTPQNVSGTSNTAYTKSNSSVVNTNSTSVSPVAGSGTAFNHGGAAYQNQTVNAPGASASTVGSGTALNHGSAASQNQITNSPGTNYPKTNSSNTNAVNAGVTLGAVGTSVNNTGANANPLPGYTGAIGCARPISSNEFNDLKTSISSKDFEDSKLTLTKQMIDNNCLLSSQVKEIVELFDFEDTKLDLAKYAYKHTYDIGNYYQVSDAFSFDGSITELDKYIKANSPLKK